ncbi:hypothetical protein ES288_D10G309200v1 [Gossypium darwinii]|uniref:DUF4408 domain-containing protein n=1 Tax=Gossypium darwinii TaxID=34276 RepID=A0A5D2B3U3_GOSDA|nr:hypothetical protein ES288_D10G309200v1 [Gossypium darwinii]
MPGKETLAWIFLLLLAYLGFLTSLAHSAVGENLFKVFVNPWYYVPVLFPIWHLILLSRYVFPANVYTKLGKYGIIIKTSWNDMDQYFVWICFFLGVMNLCSSRFAVPGFMFTNSIIFIDLSFTSTYSIRDNLTNKTVALGISSFVLLLLRNFVQYRDNVLVNANVVHPPSEGGDAPQQEHRIPMPSNMSPLPTVGAEIELAPRSESRHHPPAPSSSVEVELTTGVSTLAPRQGSRRRPGWSRIDMVSTMYHPEAQLDSPLLAPVRSLSEIGRRRSLTRYDLEPPTPLLPRTPLGGDFSSTMRFRNQSSQTVAEGSMITPVRPVRTSIFKGARTV